MRARGFRDGKSSGIDGRISDRAIGGCLISQIGRRLFGISSTHIPLGPAILLG